MPRPSVPPPAANADRIRDLVRQRRELAEQDTQLAARLYREIAAAIEAGGSRRMTAELAEVSTETVHKILTGRL